MSSEVERAKVIADLADKLDLKQEIVDVSILVSATAEMCLARVLAENGQLFPIRELLRLLIAGNRRAGSPELWTNRWL